ncbi:FK506-binding protein 15 isoform X1 [Eleutherodactylus coqui]|uniref:FK506-binding protein 15 isoform X1 n=1 Tax=Eleutherodactylus coqui TaxID=57060 RepID=UPI003462F6C1
MFGPDEEDTDFLSPTGGAKLASLFGMDQTGSGQGNESFQYTAPKQPKKGAVPAGPKSPKPPGASGTAPTVLYATAVHAYKYVNGQFVKQGKFGAAVLGTHTTKEYRILLYISQQQPVAAVRIHPGFVFTVQLNNYAAFYDDQRQSWSVMFESETAAVEFSKQVCLAKCNSAPSVDGVVSQDLLLGDGPAADVGDLMEVSYTGWLLQNHGVGQMFDSNVQKDKLLRLKLGSGKVIKGWEEGMLGMKKGGKRLVVIPPALGYGSQGLSGRIPSNATLVFEVEVKRMKQKEPTADRQSIGSRDSPVSITDSIPAESLPQPPTSVPPKPGDPDVRAKSNSISEQLANPDMAKAKLISRMAKMGQPMLPFLAGSSTPQPDSSDSEIEDPNTQRISPHPAAPLPVRPTQQISHPPHIAAPVPHQQPVSGLPTSSAALLPMGHLPSQGVPAAPAPGFQPYSGIQYTYPQNPSTQLQPVGHVYPAPVQQPATYQASGDVTSFLMTESRQQSTEIRMAIGKVIDKIDNLASKVDNLQKENSAGASHLLPGISSITMESAMIMNNIQRIIQENERLKQEVLDKSSRIEEQNVKIGELITRNQRYVEQSNMLMEQRNDSLKTTSESTQAKMLHAMQEKARVAEELSAATGQLSQLQLEVTAYQKKEMDLRTQLAASLQEAEKCRGELGSLQAQLIEMKETSEHTKNRARSEKDSRRSLELRLTALEDEISDLKMEKENLEKSLSERKKKSQQERQRAEEEQEELRRTFQEEVENLRRQLKKSREQATVEQLSSRDHDEQKLQDQAAQIQPLRDKCAQLQRQVTSLNDELGDIRVRESELLSAKDRAEEKLLRLQEGAAQLEPLRLKCAQLQTQVASLTEQLGDASVTKDEGRPAGDPAEEVKKIMNGVFQSLRKEFDVEESYSGRAVLGTIMSTIKATTLQLLNKTQDEPPAGSSGEEEEEEEGDEEAEITPQPEPHVPSIQAPPSADRGQAEEAPQTINGYLSQEAAVEDEVVKVIEEDLDTPSALVHMISSDMPESSIVTHVEEIAGETLQPGTAASNDPPVSEPPTEVGPVSGDSKVDVQKSEEPPAPLSKTKEEENREDPPGSNEDIGISMPPTGEIPTHRPTGSPEVQGKKGVSPVQEKTGNVSLAESDEKDLFKAASPPTKAKLEEEEEEEVSMKGRPPPTPLFGEDDEEDDLDWLG